MRAEDNHVILSYRIRRPSQEWADECDRVRIVRTRCTLGGSRPWFICPIDGCGRRVAILYGTAVFACRRCHQLVYASSRQDETDRIFGKADKLRDLLGWQPGIVNGHGGKPRLMVLSRQPMHVTGL